MGLLNPEFEGIWARLLVPAYSNLGFPISKPSSLTAHVKSCDPLPNPAASTEPPTGHIVWFDTKSPYQGISFKEVMIIQ